MDNSTNSGVLTNDVQLTAEEIKAVKKQVSEKIGFIGHFFTYICVNSFLLALNLTTGRESLWVIWPAFFWGIGLLSHFGSVFVYGSSLKNLQDKWTQEEIEKLRASKK